MEHELVIFDNSGVLVDSEALGNLLLARMLTDEVVPTAFTEAVEHYMGKSFADVVEAVHRRTGAALPAGFADRFHDRLYRTFERELTAVEGVHDVLDGLDARGIPYCVASNDTADRVALSLELTGLAERLAGRIFGADQVDRPKPSPDLFLLAARRSGVAPGACLVVEDSARGVAAARARV